MAEFYLIQPARMLQKRTPTSEMWLQIIFAALPSERQNEELAKHYARQEIVNNEQYLDNIKFLESLLNEQVYGRDPSES